MQSYILAEGLRTLRSWSMQVMDLFKIRQSIMLTTTGVISYLIASKGSIDPVVLAVLTVAIFLTVAGSTGFNMVIDSDIDSIMVRTKRRVIPSGKLDTRAAVAISVISILVGLYLSYIINIWVFISGLLGILIYVYIYTFLTKRKTWTSVIYGGFAGGMPALGGYVAYTGYPTLEAIILVILIALWSNAHIWYIAIYNYQDFKKAGIPSLPHVKGIPTAIKYSIIHIVLLIVALIALFYISGLRYWITLAIGIPLSIAIIRKMMHHINNHDKIEIYKMFKLLSPYLLFVFLAILSDSILNSKAL